ncbi:distal tail protein Dit [Clostridium tyrobutyricum]|uniref:distal tail protein Dit n=1 Tax=Clostridium tyrobutyricum TaxID=1519 RepID=UPI001C389501|nr:distal tail protein Dit [Clostridium tyrobutyricum]MBV4423158.1 phage tail family protein [Clostridium tyrobutyricum]MBV4424927.1 phage tail family protein [Clostridium tyrobutyricum]
MSVRDGFIFNGKHSYKDFNVWLQEKKIQPPAKVKIKETIPFMNGTYDFSSVGSNGEPVYGERQIQVKLGLRTRNKKELYTVYQLILEWLEDTGRQELLFDNIPGFYFTAEVESAPSFEEALMLGNLTITFTAQPFKVSTSYMGDDIWDTFNFLTDYTQYTNIFEINEDGPGTTVIMYNNGRNITPVINVSVDNMRLSFEGKIYYLTKGDNKLWGMKLKNGENVLHFYNALGTVKILFRWEVL